MSLRCRRCNRPIKAQTLIERGILVSYGPVCARVVFVMPAKKVARVMAFRNRQRIGVNQSQLELELEVA